MEDIRIFLDSNVILSGLLSSRGNPRIILDLLSIKAPLLAGMTGAYNIEEIERNLKTKFPQLESIYREYFPKMNLTVIPLPSYEEIKPFISKMSPKDVPVLVSARSGKADYLITGNKKDFPKELVKPIRLVNPKEFLDHFEGIVRGE